MQSRGSELGSVGLLETQVFFVWPDLYLCFSPHGSPFFVIRAVSDYYIVGE